MWVWGVDVSTKRVAIAAVPGDDTDAATTVVEFPAAVRSCGKGDTGDLYGVYTLVRLAAVRFSWDYPPTAIIVEKPAGKVVTPVLWLTVGATITALQHFPGLLVTTLPVGTWKRWSVGRGDASKADVAAWALETFGHEDDQDVADALGVAVAGRQLVVEA